MFHVLKTVAILLLAAGKLHTSATEGCHFDRPVARSATVAGGPEQHSENEDRLFRQFRLDIIKEKMLRSLGLTAAPRLAASAAAFSSINSLKNDLKWLPIGRHEAPKDSEHRKTRSSSKVFVFAELGSSSPCRLPLNATAEALTPVSFKLPHSPNLIRSAVLWYQNTPAPGAAGEMWMCPCAAHQLANESGPLYKDVCVSLTSSHDPQEVPGGGPARRTMTTTSFQNRKNWSVVRLNDFGLMVPPLSHSLRSMMGTDRRIVFLLGGKPRLTERKRPYLVLKVGNETPKRVKRSVPLDCQDAGAAAGSCCRTGFWVDVEQLGWSDWIISPTGFYYHYCSGQCSKTFDSFSSSSAEPSPLLDYSQVINAYVRRVDLNLRPCCVPRTMSHLPVVITTDGLTMNRTFIPNFIVNKCACLGIA